MDYSKVLSSEDKENEFEQMILSEYANLWPDVRIKSGRIEEGIFYILLYTAMFWRLWPL